MAAIRTKFSSELIPSITQVSGVHSHASTSAASSICQCSGGSNVLSDSGTDDRKSRIHRSCCEPLAGLGRRKSMTLVVGLIFIFIFLSDAEQLGFQGSQAIQQ